MPATCPLCLTADLPDGAAKCRACGSWLDPARDSAAPEAIRAAVRAELRDDLKEHRAYLEGLLGQLKYVAALVVAAGLAAAVFFGVRTDQSITATAARIAQEAEAQIKTATADLTVTTRERVAQAVAAKMAAPETAALIESTLRDSVVAETGRRMEPFKAQVDAQVSEAVARLDAVTGEIGALQDRSRAAFRNLDAIEAAFGQAQRQTVAGSQSVLPVDPVVVEEKGGLDRLAVLLREPVGALGFRMGNYYDGPVVWAYVDRLRGRPGFRDILIFDRDGAFAGQFPASALAEALDPPGAAQLRRVFADDLGRTQLPSPDAVPGWTMFADAARGGDLAAIAAIPGFVAADQAVRADWTSLKALDHLERTARERLPVIDAAGGFVGMIDRSRLTTRVLLDLAGG